MNFFGADILSVKQFGLPDIDRVFKLAERLRTLASGRSQSRVLEGKILGNLFYEPSTRTRMSFASAFMRLGGQVNSSTGIATSSIAKGESLADTITMVQTYCDVLVIRHSEIGAAAEAAIHSQVPVINAGDGVGEHPTQALQDLYTIFAERGTVDGATIALVGDLKYGRCPHSLIHLLKLYKDITVTLVAPDELQMDSDEVARLRAEGCRVHQTTDVDDGISTADILYWTRIQEERISTPIVTERVRRSFTLDAERFRSVCKPTASILHPLPRITELARDLDALPNAAYFRQADNSMLIRMALLLLVLGKDADYLDEAKGSR